MSIYSHTNYNPAVHSSIVQNFRAWVKGQRFNFDLEGITDADIFAAWRDLYSVDDSDIVDGLYGLMLEHIAPDFYEAKLISEQNP